MLLTQLVHGCGGKLQLIILPAFSHSESDVIHLLEQHCLVSRTVNKGFQLTQTMTKTINLNVPTTNNNKL
jgi:hypothetical protein